MTELRTHYGPTINDPNPGTEWHYDCGGMIYSFREGRICSKCGAGEDYDEPSSTLDIEDTTQNTAQDTGE